MHLFKFTYEPIYEDLGTKHTRIFRAKNYENALKRAKKEEKFKFEGRQVYRLVYES